MRTSINELANAFTTLRKAMSERLKETEKNIDKQKELLGKLVVLDELEEIKEDVDALERLVERYLY